MEAGDEDHPDTVGGAAHALHRRAHPAGRRRRESHRPRPLHRGPAPGAPCSASPSAATRWRMRASSRSTPRPRWRCRAVARRDHRRGLPGALWRDRSRRTSGRSLAARCATAASRCSPWPPTIRRRRSPPWPRSGWSWRTARVLHGGRGAPPAPTCTRTSRATWSAGGAGVRRRGGRPRRGRPGAGTPLRMRGDRARPAGAERLGRAVGTGGAAPHHAFGDPGSLLPAPDAGADARPGGIADPGGEALRGRRVRPPRGGAQHRNGRRGAGPRGRRRGEAGTHARGGLPHAPRTPALGDRAAGRTARQRRDHRAGRGGRAARRRLRRLRPGDHPLRRRAAARRCIAWARCATAAGASTPTCRPAAPCAGTAR